MLSRHDSSTIDLAPGESLLEGALQAPPRCPLRAALGGACGTCRVKTLSTGTIEMDQNFALNQAELDAGDVLTCQVARDQPDRGRSTTTLANVDECSSVMFATTTRVKQWDRPHATSGGGNVRGDEAAAS